MSKEVQNRAARDVDEIETTRSEKFLAVILAIFLGIGVTWFYAKLADWLPEYPRYDSYQPYSQPTRNTVNAVVVMLMRGVFIAGWLVIWYRLTLRWRTSGSRSLPLAWAGVAVGAVFAVVFTVNYLNNYLGAADNAPLALSVLGSVVTVFVFWRIQRLLARNVPVRRVRKAECPFCGYPVRSSGPHCEGCGRIVVATCTTCESERRVGTAHCAVCGSA